MSRGYIDADGHVMENDEDLLQFIAAPFNNRGARNMVPSLDHFHTHRLGKDAWSQTNFIAGDVFLSFVARGDEDGTLQHVLSEGAYADARLPMRVWAGNSSGLKALPSRLRRVSRWASLLFGSAIRQRKL